MKEFSLEEYLKNPERKVVTRDGRKVRIVCTDRAGLAAKPIVALITLPNGDEIVKCFWEDGIETRGVEENIYDLFFAPSKNTDYINLYRDESVYFLGAVYTSEEYAKNIAKGNDQYITTIKVEWEE